METLRSFCCGKLRFGRTLSPDNEGMETDPETSSPGQDAQAGHSAPTMRGWKLDLLLQGRDKGRKPDTQPRQ